MSVWLAGLILLAVLAACVLYIAWFGGEVVKEVIRRRELRRWETGVLHRLASPGSDQKRLEDLQRLHDIVNSRLDQVGAEAPSLRRSLEQAMYMRTTQPDLVRQRAATRSGRLPSVASITRLIELVDAEAPVPKSEPDAGTVADSPVVDTRIPSMVSGEHAAPVRRVWRHVSSNPLIATIIGGLTVALVLALVKLAVDSVNSGSTSTSSADRPVVEAGRWAEKAGAEGARSFRTPGGSVEGPRVQPGEIVKVVCRVYLPEPRSVVPNGYWYKLASAPWNGRYYSPANSYWNGDIPGQPPYVHHTDFAVPECP